jgi:hypothetical protein
MRWVYDRRWFWIQNGLMVLLVVGLVWVMHGISQKDWRASLWLDASLGTNLPFFAFLVSMSVFSPTFSLWLEARKARRGLPVKLSPALEAHRAKHWKPGVPGHVWCILAFWWLLIAAVWGDLAPRVFLGYRGTLGSGLYLAWEQAASPDGQQLAVLAETAPGENSHTLALVDLARGSTRRYPVGEGYRSLAWSADGRWLALGGHEGLQVMDTRSGTLVPVPGGSAMAFHPSAGLWFLSEDALWQWDPATSKASRLFDEDDLRLCLKGGEHMPSAFALSPGGRYLALSYRSYVRVLEISERREVALLAPVDGVEKELQFISEDRLLLPFQTKVKDRLEKYLQVFDVNQGKVIARIDGIDWQCSVGADRDGRWLTALRTDRCLAVWSMEGSRWVWSAPEPTIPGERCPRFIRDGQEIATAGFSGHFLFWSLGHPIRRWRWQP